MHMISAPENILDKFFCWFNKEKKTAFFSAIISGLLTHSVIMVLQPVCADPVLFLDWYKSEEWFLINQGRWATNIFTSMRGYLVDPVLSTIITIFSVAIFAMLTVDILQIKKKHWAFLTGVAIAVHPYIANSMMYYSTDGTILNALSALGIWLIYRTNKNNIVKVLLSTFLYTLVLGASQAFICTLTTFIIIAFIIDVLQQNIKRWEHFFVNMISCGLACISYEIIWLYLIKKVHAQTLWDLTFRV